jgi:tight adherence protein C
MSFVSYAALSLIAGLVALLVAAPIVFRPSAAEKRMQEVARTSRADARKLTPRKRLANSTLAVAYWLRSSLGLSHDEKLRQRFIAGGMRPGPLMEAYFAVRLLAPLAGVALGTRCGDNAVPASLVLAFFGYMLPDLWLTHMQTRRRNQIRRGIPDAIDMMVICVDAGLGIDQALLKVGQELAIVQPALSQELLRVNLEQRAGKPRVEAWRAMAERTQIAEFMSLVNMLVQTDRFGTPIIRALGRFAGEIRAKRRQRAEEAAAKSKVKILFPLVLFIFPTIFIVLLGPALLNIMKSFDVAK